MNTYQTKYYQKYFDLVEKIEKIDKGKEKSKLVNKSENEKSSTDSKNNSKNTNASNLSSPRHIDDTRTNLSALKIKTKEKIDLENKATCMYENKRRITSLSTKKPETCQNKFKTFNTKTLNIKRETKIQDKNVLKSKEWMKSIEKYSLKEWYVRKKPLLERKSLSVVQTKSNMNIIQTGSNGTMRADQSLMTIIKVYSSVCRMRRRRNAFEDITNCKYIR
ncbi:hypothetical protein A3Q56_06472 [Intoshia linei]|uniref:Uncharacterized protein n=1 Tax=Intoshia linei TaxID=1819745 RepID=A0A177AV05_9BILA|nr:hypothetical protein A3Q56_06472 [Intoshia linei]